MNHKAVRCAVQIALFTVGAPLTAEPVPITNIQEELKLTVERAVSERFLDPWSAQFGRLSGNLDLDKGMIVTCGMVNTKNSMGGYVGFEPFFVIWTIGSGVEYVATSTAAGEDFVREKCARDGLELTVWP